MDLIPLIDGYLSKEIGVRLKKMPKAVLDCAEEIRIRRGQAVCVRCGRDEFCPDKAYLPSAADIEITVSKMSEYSVYAFNEEIKRGYLTLPGGYRVGICGSVVYNDSGGISTIKNISSLNIRISREVKGCADKIMPLLYKNGRFLNTLIISPPACGKTTLLRDIIRQVSSGGLCVGVADERSEIAGTYMGQAANDLGSRTDILDGIYKEDGMYMLLRSMGVQVIAADEIGSAGELECIRHIVNSGVSLLCSVHAESLDELKRRNGFDLLVADKLFKRYIILSTMPSAGSISGIYDEEMKPCL